MVKSYLFTPPTFSYNPLFTNKITVDFQLIKNMLYIFYCLKAQFYVVLISSVYLKSYHIGPEA